MRDEAYGAPDRAQESGAKEQARETIAQVKERTTEQVESRLAQQKSRAAETLNGVSQSLLLTSQHLRDQQQDNVSRYVERAAEEVDRLAHYLDTRNVSEIVHQVESLARRQPAVFLGGAVALGFVAARFLKSGSHAHERDDRLGDGRQQYRRYEEPSFTRGENRGMTEVTAPRLDTGW